ncbi:MAG: zinc-dependent metalloprotease, partial [Longimicrobiales bacterium]
MRRYASSFAPVTGLVTMLLVTASCASAPVQEPRAPRASNPGDSLPTIAEKTAGLESQDGFVPVHYDPRTGKLYLEVARFGEELLYLNSLATGLGSAALGLDRGTIGDNAVVRFERHGPNVFLVRTHPGYRAVTDNQALKRSVAESFAVSVIGSFPIVAEGGSEEAEGEAATEGEAEAAAEGEAEAVLVDATEFFLTDMFGAGDQLEGYDVDADRSAIWLPRTKTVPENTEVEALLTFAGDEPSAEVRRHTPDARSVTLREHHSFVKLPDDGYSPRVLDPRIGVFAVEFQDFSQPLEDGYERRLISRHRLIPSDSAAWRAGELVEPVEPIVYYLDPAFPEPYRAAFHEGASWWNEVFEAAGFENAFIVREMPADMDPMDARYNVVQWVHRSGPAFSIGPSYVDPRTGEIIKAAVRMDTYRSITDYNIWAGAKPALADVPSDPRGAGAIGGCLMMPPAVNEAWLASLDPLVSGEAFAMARRRQHVAHEIGHTLGLAHNFIAESYGRASVMDYPAPLMRLREDGTIDLTEAYRNGPGAYDSLAIRYAYTPYLTEAAEAEGLAAIAREAIERDLRFITGGDAADDGSIPLAHRWIHGSDVVAELDRVNEVRDVLLERFGEAAIQPDQPMALLNRRLAPVYLHHRYALEAAIKAVGGMDYRYTLRGDGQTPTAMIPADRQRAALEGLVAALDPGALAVPERIVTMIPPAPFGYSGTEWAFDSPAGPAFD